VDGNKALLFLLVKKMTSLKKINKQNNKLKIVTNKKLNLNTLKKNKRGTK
jgi:hypothetical protein